MHYLVVALGYLLILLTTFVDLDGATPDELVAIALGVLLIVAGVFLYKLQKIIEKLEEK